MRISDWSSDVCSSDLIAVLASALWKYIRQPGAPLLVCIVMAKRRCEMRLAHDTYVVVADGDKMLLFRNQGGAEYHKLELQSELVQDNPADREQGPAQHGRASNHVGYPRSQFQETDFHELAQARCTHVTANILNTRQITKEHTQTIAIH